MMNDQLIGGDQRERLLKDVSEGNLDENFTKLTNCLPEVEMRLLDLKEPRVKIGQKIFVETGGIRLPKVNYLTGGMEEVQLTDEYPILAEFDSISGKKRVKCDYDKGVISFTVPEGAVDSMVNFLIPMCEENAKSCSLDKDAEMISSGNDVLYLKDSRYVYLHYRGIMLIVKCDSCKTNSICPFGAIKFDSEDNCFVDKSICRGQTRVISGTEKTPDGRYVNSVKSEIPCFLCFNGTESLSSKCLQRKVSKVMDSSTCACGQCSERMQIVAGVCLRGHCDYDAISGGASTTTRCGNQPSMDNLGGIYKVDFDKCVGCYECYDNIICERVVMKAHIKKRAKANFNILKVNYDQTVNPHVAELHSKFPDNRVYFRIWGRGRNVLIDRWIDVQFPRPGELREPVPILPHSIEMIDRLFITASVKPAFSKEPPIGAGHPVAETKVIDLKNMMKSPYPRLASFSLKFFGVIELEYTLSELGYI